jgi:hypothetical protein
VQLAPDALAQTLHAVLKNANYKEIPLLPTCCRFSLVLSLVVGYFVGLAPVLDTQHHGQILRRSHGHSRCRAHFSPSA